MASNIEEPEDANRVRSDFDPFLDDVASVFTPATVKKLAPTFGYTAEEIEEYEKAKNPGHSFTKSLNEKHIISSENISRLIYGLKAIGLDGLSDDVQRFFEKSRKVAEIEDRKKTFIDTLKRTYRDYLGHIQPIPFSKDRLLHVDDVFLDVCIEVSPTEGLTKSWKKLTSRHCIFDDSRKDATRFILFGRPGYGKLTLAQQLANDWRTKCKESPLKKVEIFILLKLSRVSVSFSIFQSIKQHLLRSEPTISVADVEEVLHNTKSAVIVLQGFDAYARNIGRHRDDVTKIIAGDMFPNFPVILTTTPARKPPNLPPSTIRMKLTGFDTDNQDKYFRKALGDDAFDKIKPDIDENQVIRELCKVPFVFGLFLNLICVNNVPFSFKTITGFVRYTIGSYYEQRKLKLRKEDRKYGELKENHRKLNKKSFEVLMKTSQDKKWTKDEIRKAIGGELYDQYVAMGILAEEEDVVINESLSASPSDLVKRTIYTKFYHSIFREWFAAHYVCEFAAKTFTFGGLDAILMQLYERKNEAEHVFQFACGIHPRAASKIIRFLQQRNDSRGLVPLCIREQEEYGKKR